MSLRPAAVFGACLFAACNNSDTTQPNPLPSPSPVAVASPSPSPSPAVAQCTLAAMPDCSAPQGPPGVYGCCRHEDRGVFLDRVDAAVLQYQRENPSNFQGDRVLDQDRYMLGVVEVLRRNGLCATRGGPEDEVAVKNSNDFNEQFDILLSSGSIRLGAYEVTCRPARF